MTAEKGALARDETEIGDLVKVATAGPEIDGIVFDLPSNAKAVVALIDRTRGPALRSVPRSALSERVEDGPDDQALRQLIRRTPVGGHGGGSGGGSGAGPGSAGYRRAATHRTTGR